MAKLYAGCCGHGVQLADGIPGDLDALIDELVKQIFDTKQMPDGGIDKPTTGAMAGEYWNGIEKGYGKTIGIADYDTPDFNMLAELQKNAYVFAAAKDYQMAKAISEQLIDADGKLRSFKDFQIAANQITGMQTRWLKNEYDTAIASAQQAAKWVDIVANKHLFPLLEFDAVLDNHTTELCRSLDGVIRPVDDAFWQQYYPPNHWNCRSTVRQLRTGTVTPGEDIHPSADIPDLFKVNLPQHSLAFPDTHPYYNGTDREKLEDAALATFRNEQKQKALQTIRNTSVEVEGLGKVKITKVTISKISSQALDANNKWMQLRLLTELPEIMSKLKFVKEAPDTKEQKGLRYLYYAIEWIPDFYVNIREQMDGSYIVYTINDKIK